MTRWIKGTELSPAARREALSAFVHRFTRDNVPAWARKPRPDGTPYPVQFDSDADWLENTLFPVNAAGNLSGRERYCSSAPTWPDNPELRKAVA